MTRQGGEMGEYTRHGRPSPVLMREGLGEKKGRTKGGEQKQGADESGRNQGWDGREKALRRKGSMGIEIHPGRKNPD